MPVYAADTSMKSLLRLGSLAETEICHHSGVNLWITKQVNNSQMLPIECIQC